MGTHWETWAGPRHMSWAAAAGPTLQDPLQVAPAPQGLLPLQGLAGTVVCLRRRPARRRTALPVCLHNLDLSGASGQQARVLPHHWCQSLLEGQDGRRHPFPAWRHMDIACVLLRILIFLDCHTSSQAFTFYTDTPDEVEEWAQAILTASGT